MGLREAILSTVILGMATATAAEAKPTRAAPSKAASKPADVAPAEPTEPAAPAEADDATGANGAEQAEMPAHIVGPKHVDLGNNASIDLPAGMVMFERAVAQELLRKGGDPADGIVALVFNPESSWHVSIEYTDSGYIDDDDADDLDADELLDSYRKGTAEQNKIRKSLGKSELLIDNWSEAPRYERPAHRLAWGINAHSVDGKVINFITRVLGRTGFLSVDLIDAPERIEASKQEAVAVLQGTTFNAGSTYTDHVNSDRSSGIGLRGLVLGGAGVAVASKLGLLAKILLVFKKLIVLFVVGIGGLFRWLVRRKPSKPDALAGHGIAPTDLGRPVDMSSSSVAPPGTGGPTGDPPAG